jgi:hypothetical protein
MDGVLETLARAPYKRPAAIAFPLLPSSSHRSLVLQAAAALLPPPVAATVLGPATLGFIAAAPPRHPARRALAVVSATMPSSEPVHEPPSLLPFLCVAPPTALTAGTSTSHVPPCHAYELTGATPLLSSIATATPLPPSTSSS